MELFKKGAARDAVTRMTSDGLRASLRALIIKNDPKKKHLLDAVKRELDKRGERYES